MARITVVESTALADTAASRITELIEQSIVARGTANVSLTGGSTPRSTYEAIGDPARPWRHRIDWSRVHLFWGDERRVPPDHPDSNFGMAYRALVQHVPIPAQQVHRMRGELPDAEQAAAEYSAQLPDSFDVMLLGLGNDGHIASIAPGSSLLHGDRGELRRRPPPPRNVRPATMPDSGSSPTPSRITLTPGVILDSRAIVLLVSGQEKAAAVAAAIEGPLDVDRCPAQLLREANDRVDWVLDDEAARHLHRPTRGEP